MRRQAGAAWRIPSRLIFLNTTRRGEWHPAIDINAADAWLADKHASGESTFANQIRPMLVAAEILGR
jgi:hypothetical protein